MKKSSETRIKSGGKGTRHLKSLFTVTGLILLLHVGHPSANAQSVSIRLQNADLEQVLKEIQKTTDYHVFYNAKTVQHVKGLQLDFHNATIEEVLAQALKGTSLSYAITSKTIVIRTKQAPGSQQNYLELKGTVKDSKNEPLPGASVVVKGTSIGVSTDIDGNFSIRVPSNVAAITVSFIGYQPQDIAVLDADPSKPHEYQVVLAEENSQMEEVVVTGYQTISKERSTGSFAKVSSETLQLRRTDDLGNMLEGQIAGYTNGQIRGITTMNAVAQPMVVIDGFPVENTSMDRSGRTSENMPELNPEDIENITVLKDAAAASIYGARAANGVIVITTKKARQGKTEISASATFTVQPYSFYTGNLTNAADVVDMERQWAAQSSALQAGGSSALQKANAIRNDDVYPSAGIDLLLDRYTGAISADEAERRLNSLASSGYRYYDQMARLTKRNPVYQQYNVRIGKTSDRNSINASATYWRNRQEDLYSNDDKLSLNLTNYLHVTEWLDLDLGVYLKYGKETAQTYDPLSPGFHFLPYDAWVDEEGANVSVIAQRNKEERDNLAYYNLYDETITPMKELGLRLSHSRDFNSRAYAKFQLTFTPWLNYHVMYQHETGNKQVRNLQEKESYATQALINAYASAASPEGNEVIYNIPNGDIYATQEHKTTAYNFRQQLNLNKTFGDRHNIVWIAGNEIRNTKLEYTDNTLYGYDSKLLTWENIDAKKLATGVNGVNGFRQLTASSIVSSKEIINRFVSFYSNASYTLDDRYSLSGSIRWDRSNLWGSSAKNQNKPLWSVGFSWLISKEAFFQSNVMDMLKLRGSYGIGGNIGRNTAPYLVASYWLDYKIGELAGYVKTPPNDNIRWEKTQTVNFGLDFSAFHARLNGTIDVYNKKSNDLLANINGSPTQGFGYATLTTNNGAMLNRGFELTLRGDLIRKGDFSWNATLLYAYNKNKVTQVNVKAFSYDMQIKYPTTYPVKNKPFNGIYGYKGAGLDENGDPQVYNADNEIVSTAVQDLNAIHYFGTTVPPHSGTFTHIFSYRNVEVSAMLLFEAGHKIRETNIPRINMQAGRIRSTAKDISRRWRKPDDITDVPRLLFDDDEANYKTYRTELYEYSDQFIYNASNLKVRNISVAYRLPQDLCKRLMASAVKLQFNVENAATWAFDKKAHYVLGGKIKPNYVCSINVNF